MQFGWRSWVLGGVLAATLALSFSVYMVFLRPLFELIDQIGATEMLIEFGSKIIAIVTLIAAFFAFLWMVISIARRW